MEPSVFLSWVLGLFRPLGLPELEASIASAELTHTHIGASQASRAVLMYNLMSAYIVLQSYRFQSSLWAAWSEKRASMGQAVTSAIQPILSRFLGDHKIALHQHRYRVYRQPP